MKTKLLLAIAPAAAFLVSNITADASDRDAASIKRGKTIYDGLCAACHADSGEGVGVDLTDLRQQSDSELFRGNHRRQRPNAILRCDLKRATAVGCSELPAHPREIAARSLVEIHLYH
jgi:hypothetical protein